jgi:hypothetical protein
METVGVTKQGVKQHNKENSRHEMACSDKYNSQTISLD